MTSKLSKGRILARAAFSLGLSCGTATFAFAQSDRPNIVVIVADDLGYSDLSAFGGEIPTPNLDSLAGSGVQLTNFHVAPTCSPTRAMLLTGTDNHTAGVGNMAEEMLPDQRGKKGYDGYLNHDVVALPALLRDAGYHTAMAGKWHLGVEEDQRPGARGFETSFALLNGGAHHFDQTGMVSKAPKATYTRDDKPVDLPSDFYTSDSFTDEIIGAIGSTPAGKPFFAYLSYTAPHWPLQAPDEDIARFRGKYDAGYDAIQQARLKRMTELGLVPEGVQANRSPLWPRWEELDAEQRAHEARRMEVYAAMVSRVDQNVGRLVNALKEAKAFDNTVFVFLSDNGAEGQLPEDIMGGKDSWWIEENFDNSLDNLGRRSSYFGYGPNWAAVSQTPFRMNKGYTYEGGTRSPAFVTYPGWRNGEKADAFLQVKDVAPTLLELAGVTAPSVYNGKAVAPIEGTSMLDWLQGKAAAVHADTKAVCTELFGRVAIWKGDWKLAFSNSPWGTGDWELFNLRRDPAEASDQSGQEVGKLAELKTDWDDCQARHLIFWNTGLSANMVYTNKDFYLFRPER